MNAELKRKREQLERDKAQHALDEEERQDIIDSFLGYGSLAALAIVAIGLTIMWAWKA